MSQLLELTPSQSPLVKRIVGRSRQIQGYCHARKAIQLFPSGKDSAVPLFFLLYLFNRLPSIPVITCQLTIHDIKFTTFNPSAPLAAPESAEIRGTTRG